MESAEDEDVVERVDVAVHVNELLGAAINASATATTRAIVMLY